MFGNLVLGLGCRQSLGARPWTRRSRSVPPSGDLLPGRAGNRGAIVGACLLFGLDRRLAQALDVAPYLSALRLLFLFIWIDLGAGSCLNYLLARKRFGTANVLTLLRGSMLAPVLGMVWLWRGSFGITTIAAAWLVTGAGALAFGAIAAGVPAAVRVRA